MTEATLIQANNIRGKLFRTKEHLEDQRITEEGYIRDGFWVYKSEPFYEQVNEMVRKLRKEYILNLEKELADL